MQEDVVGSGVPNGGPGWYLARGDKQYGPLTDRELSLFAEGGNFQTGDLLWTEGLETWEPADPVFAIALSPGGSKRAMPSPNGARQSLSAPISDPNVNALVQALARAAEPPKATLKTKVIEELKRLVGIFLYLWLVFFVLFLHEWVVLSNNHIGFTFYGLAAVNAIVLAKVMLLADKFRFAEQLRHKPLVYPIVYKSAAFTTLLFVAYLVEEMLVGWFHGDGLVASIPSLGAGPLGAFCIWLIFCIALIPFFAFTEIERAIGSAEFRVMVLGRGPAALRPRR
jgi:hypothetical protein